MLWSAAPVLALPLQQVVGLQHHRRIVQQFFAQRFATDTLLQQGKRLHGQSSLGFTRFPDQDLAVEHHAIGQTLCQTMQFGETLGNQFFAA
ncbi:hypothetical protein D3C75_1070340 [compost metagenome]